MSTWMLIAVRAPEEGKSRLSQCLDADCRLRLNVELFRNVMDVASKVAGPERVLIVTSSDLISSLGAEAGVRVLPEFGQGQNAALYSAYKVAVALGAETLVTLSTDLPFLCTDDLYAMNDLQQGGSTPVIATDRHGIGTNALLFAASDFFGFHFGPSSCAKHSQAAAKQGHIVEVVIRPGLAWDIDTPQDLSFLLEQDTAASNKYMSWLKEKLHYLPL